MIQKLTTHLFGFLVGAFFIISCGEKEKITETNYIKIDNRIWDNYELRAKEIDSLMIKFPNKRDSIMVLYNLLEEKSSKENIEAAIKYAKTKSGFERIFMLRTDINKNILRNILTHLPKETQNSKYGMSLKAFINFNQISKESLFYDFNVVNIEGEKILFSSIIKENNVLLIYGGLKCIGVRGRKYLKELQESVKEDELKFIVYEPVLNLEELRKEKEKYNLKAYFISDFLEDHSPMKINYGAQTLPTSFLINKKGIVISADEGIPDELIKKLFINNKKNKAYTKPF